MTTELQLAIKAQEEHLLACVHCGLCLPHCPTYGVLGDENDSPRGRLYLMRAVAEGRLEPNDTYTRHIEACIVCRACETACPSGVEYGYIMQAARNDLRRTKHDDLGFFARVLRRVGLDVVITRRMLLKPIVWPMRIVRHLRPRNGWSRRLPRLVRQGLEMLPNPPVKRPKPAKVQSTGTRRVVQFRGCIMDELYGDVNDATTRILKVNGCAVDEPSEQVCCGALHDHAGYIDTTRMLARRNIDAFDDGTDDPILINAAGCGATLREYGHLLADDPTFAIRAKRFASRVRDVTEFLAELSDNGELVKGAPINARVTYDAPCHLYHAQRIIDPPLRALNAVPDLDFVPLRGYDRCCGSGGIYSLTHQVIASDVLEEKLAAIRETEADILVTANPGCQMQIQSGARMSGMNLRVLHIIQLIDESYDRAGYYSKKT